MQIITKLELEDIITRPFGNNIAITPPNTNRIFIFSQEAAKELLGDLATVLDILEKEEGE